MVHIGMLPNEGFVVCIGPNDEEANSTFEPGGRDLQYCKKGRTLKKP